jgi:biopolymer transport protein ExbD
VQNLLIFCRNPHAERIIFTNEQLLIFTMSIRKKYVKENAEVDTGPLNDILFILMFFFLIISTLANPNVIKMNNPRATSETKAKQSVIVSINKNRDIYLGQQKIIFDSLESSLKKQLRIGDSIKPAVVINADSLVSWGDIVRVMQVAKKLGATTSASVSSAK